MHISGSVYNPGPGKHCPQTPHLSRHRVVVCVVVFVVVGAAELGIVFLLNILAALLSQNRLQFLIPSRSTMTIVRSIVRAKPNIFLAVLILLGIWVLSRSDIEENEHYGKRSHIEQCPNYAEYSKFRHLPLSPGPLQLPYMRPEKRCRTFVSPAVDRLVADLVSKVKSPDLARLIENCLPNTLDTTILWHESRLENSKVEDSQTFVVTGDIHAEWLRDASHQLSVYQPLMKHDPKLQELIKGAINTQASFIINNRYCNAFHPPPGLKVERGLLAKDDVLPRPDWNAVFECKYEIDSLASFLTLTNDYIQHSDDLLVIDESWTAAYNRIMYTIAEQSTASFDSKTGKPLPFKYMFKRNTNIGSETLPLGGVGNPVNYNTGLVRSAFRPSDDATLLQFFVPGNMQLLAELRRIKENVLIPLRYLSNLNTQLGLTTAFIDKISAGLETHAIVHHPDYGKIYAYEVDGYGGRIIMDDANVPSLLALPDFGFTTVDDPIYKNTRRMILENSGNPYFVSGQDFEGVGGPHIGISNAWPMLLLIRIRTSTIDYEISEMLRMVMETTGARGLMHELIDVSIPGGYEFTRSWFAWCNSEFGKTILWIAQNKPHLIFKDEFAMDPYNIDQVLRAGPAT